MKKILIFITSSILALSLASCSGLSDLKDRVDSLESRVEALEKAVSTLNSNVEALQALVNAGTINSVEQKDGVYTITLSNGETIVLNQGSIGVGNAPVLSIDAEGYWMVDYGNGAEYILVQGNKVLAKGENGVTPVFSVDGEGYWTVSYDGGKSFSRVLDTDGEPVKAVAGESVTDTFFKSVVYDAENGVLTLTMKNGDVVRVPVVSNFICAIEAEGDQEFAYGQTRTFNVEMKGVASCMVSAPQGWEASLEEAVLSVTAPQGETKAILADTRSDVNILAVSDCGYVTIAKLRVKFSSTPDNPVGPVDPPTGITNYFDAWENGTEIVIAGAKYSKALYGEAAHVTKDSTIASNGIYIVEPGVALNYSNDKAVQNLIIIGADPSQRTALKVDSQIKFTQADTDNPSRFVCLNVDVDASALANYVFVQNSNIALELVALDGCSVKTYAGKNFSYISPSARSIKNLHIVNSEYIVTGNNSPLLNIATSTATYGNIRFENTIFYTPGGMASGFRFFNGPSGKIEKLEIVRCTLVNLVSDTSSYVNCLTADTGEVMEVNIKDNLFYYNQTLPNNLIVMRSGINPSAGLITHNAVYKTDSDHTFQTCFGGIKNAPEGSEEAVVLAENPFSVFNQANGTFTQSDDYKGYGATR